MSEALAFAIVLILLADFFLDQLLGWLNKKTWKTKRPVELSEFYDQETYEKARQYSAAHRSLSLWQDSLNLAVMLVMITIGFAYIDTVVRTVTTSAVPMALLFFGILMFASDVMNIPFSIFRTFKIEEAYGFNKTSPATFVADKLKGYLITAFLGGGILSLIVVFFQWAGDLAWLWAWIALSAVMVFLNMFYTSLILPLFNKLTPLNEGELRSAIEEYVGNVRFPLKNIFVMDGSKRSSKANAFFSGLGSRKSIVLFDTLIEKHETTELVSVLAHEVGHYKKKHILISVFMSVAQTGVLLFFLSELVYNPDLSAALGVSEPSFHIGLLTFGILFSPVSTVIGVALNLVSRKHEFEADRFAAETSEPTALASALKKMSITHLSNLHPHPARVFFEYSHPPLIQRLAALRRYTEQRSIPAPST